MTKLYEIREVLTTLYKRHERWALPLLKFVVALIIFTKLNGFLNYAKVLNKPMVNVLLAAMASFIPGNWMTLLLMLVVTGHLAFVSPEAVAVIFIIMLMIYLLYIRLAPKMGYLIIITPLLFSLGIPHVLPVFAGLFIGPLAIVPIGIGVIIYFFGGFMPTFVAIKSQDLTNIPDSLMTMYKTMMDALFTNKALMLTIIIFVAVILITYFISRLEFDYIWYIAIVAGGVTNMLGFTIGNIVLKTDISIIGVVVGSIVAIVVVSICQFMKISLDYTRAEKVQFEDDDYIYYVKAIPKIKVGKQVKKVKRINTIPKA